MGKQGEKKTWTGKKDVNKNNISNNDKQLKRKQKGSKW